MLVVRETRRCMILEIVGVARIIVCAAGVDFENTSVGGWDV